VAVVAALFACPLFRSATSFGFPNANRVRHITLSDGKQQVQLSKRNDRWYINGSEAAQQDKAADALYALQMLEAKYPLPLDMQQPCAEQLQNAGLRVTVSGWLGSLRSYTLYRCDSLTVGVVRSGKPYALEVRGNEGLSIFSLLDVNPLNWRKTLLIGVSARELALVSVEDLSNPQRSFALSLDTMGNAKLQALYSGEQLTQLNMEHVKRYLSYYKEVSFERYATELSDAEAEEVLLSAPAYIFTIATHSGATRTFKLFHIPVGDELDAFGRPTKVDLNRCYLQQDEDTNVAVAMWVDVDLLIKDVKFFL